MHQRKRDHSLMIKRQIPTKVSHVFYYGVLYPSPSDLQIVNFHRSILPKHYYQLSPNMSSPLANYHYCVNHCWGAYEQIDIVNGVSVDACTAERAIIVRNHSSWMRTAHFGGHHQMSVPDTYNPTPKKDLGPGRPTPHLWTDKRLWKHYLPVT